jgi:hypothetical protein
MSWRLSVLAQLFTAALAVLTDAASTAAISRACFISITVAGSSTHIGRRASGVDAQATRPKGRLALSKAHAYAASLGHTPNASRFEVLTCLPVAPELPLRGSADFGTSAFFGLLSDKPLLACTLLHGVSDAKHNGWSKKLTRTFRASRLFGVNHPIGEWRWATRGSRGRARLRRDADRRADGGARRLLESAARSGDRLEIGVAIPLPTT